MHDNTYTVERKIKQHEEHRTINLVLYTSKILTKIVHKGTEKKIKENLEDNRFGLKQNRGTGEQPLRLIEKNFIISKPIYKKFKGNQKG